MARIRPVGPEDFYRKTYSVEETKPDTERNRKGGDPSTAPGKIAKLWKERNSLEKQFIKHLDRFTELITDTSPEPEVHELFEAFDAIAPLRREQVTIEIEIDDANRSIQQQRMEAKQKKKQQQQAATPSKKKKRKKLTAASLYRRIIVRARQLGNIPKKIEQPKEEWNWQTLGNDVTQTTEEILDVATPTQAVPNPEIEEQEAALSKLVTNFTKVKTRQTPELALNHTLLIAERLQLVKRMEDAKEPVDKALAEVHRLISRPEHLPNLCHERTLCNAKILYLLQEVDMETMRHYADIARQKNKLERQYWDRMHRFFPEHDNPDALDRLERALEKDRALFQRLQEDEERLFEMIDIPLK